MAAQSPAAPQLHGVSILNEDDQQRLDRARAITGMLYDLTAEMPPGKSQICVGTDSLCGVMEMIQEQIDAVSKSTEHHWNQVRDAPYVPHDVMMALLTEALQPGAMAVERMDAAGAWLEAGLRGTRLDETRALWSQILARRPADKAPQPAADVSKPKARPRDRLVKKATVTA